MVRALALVLLLACKHSGAPVKRVHGLPAITVETALPGANTTTIASAVTTPLERQFGQISNLEHMSSRSIGGSSTIYLEFAAGTELDSAARDVQAAINAASNLLPRSLPAPPTFAKVGHDGAVMRLAITIELPALDVARVADHVAEKLAQVAGVGRVRICGGVRDGWNIRVDPEALAAKGKTLDDVVTELRSGAPTDPAHAEALPLTRDVAAVAHDGIREPCTAFAGTKRAFTITVEPQSGASPEDVRQLLEVVIPTLTAELPPSATLDVMPRPRPVLFQLEFPAELTLARRHEILSAIVSKLPPEATHPLVELGAGDPDVAELRVTPTADSAEAAITQVIAMTPNVALRDREAHVVGLSGSDSDALRTELDKLATALAADKALHVVAPVGTRDVLEAAYDLDRDAMARWSIPPSVGDTTLAAIAGMRVTTIFTQLDAVPVMLSLRDEPSRSPAEALDRIYVRNASGTMIPLSAFTKIEMRRQPVEVIHVGQLPWVGLRVSGPLDALQAALAKLPAPKAIDREIREVD